MTRNLIIQSECTTLQSQRLRQTRCTWPLTLHNLYHASQKTRRTEQRMVIFQCNIGLFLDPIMRVSNDLHSQLMDTICAPLNSILDLRISYDDGKAEKDYDNYEVHCAPKDVSSYNYTHAHTLHEAPDLCDLELSKLSCMGHEVATKISTKRIYMLIVSISDPSQMAIATYPLLLPRCGAAESLHAGRFN